MGPEIPPEQLDATLDTVALEVLQDAGVRRPPVDALTVARTLGMTVALDDRQQGRARCVRLRGCRRAPARHTILLRPEPRVERLQWAIAHEIGEHTAYRVFAALGVDPRDATLDARESVASQLAGRLLLPGEWFSRDGQDCGWDLLELKRRYRTASHELIARRMLEFPLAIVVSIFDQGQLTLRRGNLPGRVPPPSTDERECQDTVNRHNRPCEMPSVRGWPVHEEGWKREILRREIGEVFD